MAQNKTHWLVTTAALVIIVAGIKAAEEIAVPFLLAVFIATIAATPVFWLNRFRVPIGLAIAMTIAGIIVLLSGVGAIVAQSVRQFRENLPEYEAKLSTAIDAAVKTAADLGFPLDSIQNQIEPSSVLELVGNTLMGFGSTLGNGFFILLTVIFILAEAASFPRKLRDVLDRPEQDLPHFEKFAVTVNRYIAIKTSVSFATGFLVWLALTIIGVDFPVLWGLLAFLLNYVPTIGSLIAAVPAVIFAFLQLDATIAIVTAAIYAAINVVMGNVIEPRFMGRGLGLLTLVVFLSLVFWNWMLGPVGMLLSVPLTMTVKIALEANPGTQWIAHLLGPADELEEEATVDEGSSSPESEAPP